MWDVKYRPLKFADVIGQEGSIQVLRARLRKGTGRDTSYIFAGGHGQGKTTLARILARALLCSNPAEDGDPCNECDNCRDALNEASPAFSEMDAASRGTIDVARSIVEDTAFSLPGVSKRIYLMDEAHRMSRDAQDVLLKPIEDKQLIAIFCTTEPEKIRGPIRSRCEAYTIRKVSREDLLRRMKWVLDQEGVAHEDDAVLTVIDYSHGHVRDILNRLEMVAQLGPVTLDVVRQYLKLGVVSTYFEILLSLGDPAKAVSLLEEVCDEVDPGDVSSGLAEAAMNAYRLSNGLHVDFSLVDKELAKRVYDQFGRTTPDLASYFVEDPYPTKISLTCRVVQCSNGVPQQRAAATTAPPVVVQATTSVAPLPPPAATVQSARPPVPAPTQVSAAPAPAPTLAANPPSSGTKRADGKGNLGSHDVEALTELDEKGIPISFPRGCVHEENRSRETRTTIGKPAANATITADQWRMTFEDWWRRRR